MVNYQNMEGKDVSFMGETISALKNELESLLNSSAFSTDSIEGWIIILLVGFIIWNIYRKALKFVGWSISVIFLFQVFHWLSMTGLNDIIPLSKVFKYDVLTSIAQCFQGTVICDVILWINATIRTICTGLWSTLCDWFEAVKNYWNSVSPS